MEEEVEPYKDIDLPDWDTYFLFKALVAASRSHDSQTQCGCVLVKDKRDFASGYNGIVRKANRKKFPNTRPEKYPYMIHAEHNALLFCARKGIATEGASAYITGLPCTDCFQFLWQAGIENIIYTNFSNPKISEYNSKTIHARKLLDTEIPMSVKFIRKDHLAGVAKIMDFVSKKV